jgi:hypothetical protein
VAEMMRNLSTSSPLDSSITVPSLFKGDSDSVVSTDSSKPHLDEQEQLEPLGLVPAIAYREKVRQKLLMR